MATAPVTYSYSLNHLPLQAPPPTATASATCSPRVCTYINLLLLPCGVGVRGAWDLHLSNRMALDIILGRGERLQVLSRKGCAGELGRGAFVAGVLFCPSSQSCCGKMRS